MGRERSPRGASRSLRLGLARISHTLSGNLHTLSTDLDALVGEAVLHNTVLAHQRAHLDQRKRQFSARLCERLVLKMNSSLKVREFLRFWAEFRTRPNLSFENTRPLRAGFPNGGEMNSQVGLGQRESSRDTTIAGHLISLILGDLRSSKPVALGQPKSQLLSSFV